MNQFKNNFHKKRFEKYLKNFFKVSEDELKKVKKLYEIEHKWWGKTKPFKINNDIEQAFQNGELVKIIEDKNFRPIMRLLNPDLDKWLPYLPHQTADLLKKIGNEWRKRVDEENISRNIKLSLTSLTRSVEYQKKIVEMGKLAVENSSHTKGKSFDIDGCGYYEGDKAINPRFTENYKEAYNSRVHQILEEILEEMKNEGIINFIPEYYGTTNQCFHVTIAPGKSLSKR
ncbi:MAG: DUF5715 family protein [Candidatus Paceibacterota bacterium]